MVLKFTVHKNQQNLDCALFACLHAFAVFSHIGLLTQVAIEVGKWPGSVKSGLGKNKFDEEKDLLNCFTNFSFSTNELTR